MHDPGEVGLGDGGERLEHVVDDLGDRERPALLQDAREVLSFEVLEHDVGEAAVELAHVHHRGHVVVLDARRGARLVEEARRRLGVPGRLGKEDLQRDPLVESLVLRGVDDAHAALPDDPLDAVLPEHRIAGQRQTGREVVEQTVVRRGVHRTTGKSIACALR